MSKPDVKEDSDESSATTEVSSARRASSLTSVRSSIPAAAATAKRYLNRAEELLDQGRDMTVGASKARPLTLVAAVLVGIAVTRPQIYSIARFSWPTGTDWKYPSLFLLYLAMMATLFVLAIEVMRRSLGATSERTERRWRLLPAPIAKRVSAFVDGVDTLADKTEEKMGEPLRRIIGWSALALGLSWLLLPELTEQPAWLGALPFRVLPCVIAVGVAAFFLTPKGMNVVRRSASQRYFVLMCTSLAFGELLWLAPDWWPGVFSYRLYSVWAITFLVFAMLATSILAEVAFRGWFTRSLCILLTLTYLLQGTGTIVQPVQASTAGIGEATRGTQWFAHLQARIDNSHEDYPVIFVAASGGGSRAAVYAALVLEALEHTHIGPEDDDGVLADNVALISGVSGGSLASAYYAQRVAARTRAERQGEDTSDFSKRAEPLNFTRTTVAGRMRSIVDAYKSETGNALEAAVRRERLAAAVAGLPETPAPDAPWLFESAFVDDMATDFMAPLLRGVLTPLLERGDSVANFWHTRFQWQRFAQQSTQPAGDAPVIALNATEVTSGKRVVIGFPPIPEELLGPEFVSVEADDPSPGLRLADGVRISANFPWGFELPDVTLSSTSDLTDSLRLIDGGVLDNTGIDTITELIDGIARLSAPAGSVAGSQEENAELRQRAARIRDALVRRGVVLLEIDSGAKPTQSKFLSSVAPAIAGPLDALSWAGYGNANSIKRGHVEQIRSAMGEMVSRAEPFIPSEDLVEPEMALGHVPFVCNRDGDVMTAWALGTDDKARLFVMFMMELAGQLPQLRAVVARPAQARAELNLVTQASGEDPKRVAQRARAVVNELVEQSARDERKTITEAGLRQESYTRLARREGLPSDRTEAPAPAKERHIGYLYIGHLNKERWTVRYADFPDGKGLNELKEGDRIVATGYINVRPHMPTEAGFGRVLDVIEPGMEVELAGRAERWRNTGYFYARIYY